MIDLDFTRDLIFTAALFGVVTFVWTGWAQERPPSTAWRIVLAVLSLGGAALAGLTVPRLLRSWDEPTAMVVGSLPWIVYIVVFWIEVIALVLGAVVLAKKGRKEFIAPLALLIVGLHFFPLAFVFGQPIMFVTAILITAAAIAAALLPREKCAPSFWCGILAGPIFLTIGTICALSA
ncbi:hypothetical protein GCM10009775_26930 [Microbacterium aoyamense]|uniref:Uncharacterized protein n=1 Tax=Microbacterium aoyamense TaxID=344166 RepID=A0ABN2PUK0_9MICO|nr:hypothetical protein [Microbacterium aoyamense]